jgi:hypothetical protein
MSGILLKYWNFGLELGRMSGLSHILTVEATILC